MLDRIYRRTVEVVTRDVAGQTLLVPLRGHLADLKRIYSLGPVAARLWEGLDGRRSLRVIVREDVLPVFEVTEAEAARDAESFVRELEATGLAAPVPPEETHAVDR
jgi:hypothetical protein